MDADRVVAALQRHVLRPGENIEKRWDRPNSVSVRARRTRYDIQPADWLVAGEPWVADAVRVVANMSIEHVPVATYGLLIERGEGELFLNDVATMRELGRRLGDELDPLAYAELLAEFHSGRSADRPVAYAPAVSEFTQAGWLVRDVDQVVAEYPFVDAGLLAPPVVRANERQVEIEFCSLHYHLGEWGAIDVLHWTVTGGGGTAATWTREYVAEGIERPRSGRA